MCKVSFDDTLTECQNYHEFECFTVPRSASSAVSEIHHCTTILCSSENCIEITANRKCFNPLSVPTERRRRKMLLIYPCLV